MFEILRKNQYFNQVVNFLREKNIAQISYLVGGSVRDILLGKDLKDLDFAVKGDSISLAKDFSKKIDGTFVLLDEVFSIGRVVKDDITIDFTELRGDSIEKDLEERDFTINAMALSIEFEKIIDPFGGINDLENGLIKIVKEQNLKADPLRILRAYRFHATLNFSIEDETRKALQKNASFMGKTARERIKEELWAIFSVSDSAKTVKLMVEDRIFNEIFKSSDLIPFNPKVKNLETLEEILRNIEKFFTLTNMLQILHFICPLKLAVLFDFQALSFLRQIKPSKKEERFIESLLKAGDRIKQIETLLDKILFIKEFEKILYPTLIYGISIDPLGISRLWFYKEIENFYRKTYLKNKRKLPIITGDDLITMGFKPSPQIGKILEKIEILVLMGKISKREEVERIITSKFTQEAS